MTSRIEAAKEYDADERSAFEHLAEFDYTTEEMIELINISFRQRHEELLTRSPSEIQHGRRDSPA